IDAIVADTDGSHQTIDAGMLGVRHGNSAADARASQLLSLHHGLDDPLHLAPLNLVGLQQGHGQLADDSGLIVRLEVGSDGLRTYKVGKLHSFLSFLAPSRPPDRTRLN